MRVSSDGSKAYKLTKAGQAAGEIHFNEPLTHSIVWTGEYFWAVGGCGRGIGKFTEDGRLVGAIYPPAEGTWALAWDGRYLWTVQRTCENWTDAKVFKIEILDDSL